MKLFYRKFGTGEPIIILHGLFGLSDNWVTIGRRLSDKFAIFIPDLRNHGQSPHSTVFNYHAMSDDIREFIVDHQIDSPVLIGHSLGGKVAMHFALNDSVALDRLVIIDTSPGYNTLREEHVRIIHAMESVDLGKVTSRAEAESILLGAISDERITLFIMKNLFRSNDGRYSWRPDLGAIHDNLDRVGEEIQVRKKFEQPVLFVKGGLSDYLTKKDEKLIFKYFPTAIIKTISNASHWVHSDAPNELCLLLSDFLGKKYGL
jgi:pimeloyl-ACP methyl ester carboxylesterase